MAFRMLSALFVAFWMLAESTLWADGPAKDRCVILVSVDGLANFYLDDPKADMPTLRRLVREGARAEGLVCSLPTVTWPNHTTLVTGVGPGKHGVIGNNYLDRKTASPVQLIVDPLFDKDEIVKAPTVYDVAHEAGLATAGILWPASRNAKSLDRSVPDMPGELDWRQYGTRTWLEEMRREGIPVDSHGTWCKASNGGPMRDWLYTRMARHVLKNHSPNLLLIHLVELDHIQHQSGPRSPEAYWAVSFIDDRLRDLVEAVEQSPLRDKTTFIIASDHGFFPVEKEIRPNVVLKSKGLWEGEKKQARCVSQGGACMLYVLDESHREKILGDLKASLAKIEGVQSVLGTDEFGELGLALPADDPRAPDLWLSAASGYSFSDSDGGDGAVVDLGKRIGTHGYLPDQSEMLGTLVLSGHGVERGVKLKKASNMDVAPTMARLLGVELPNVDGKATVEALEKPRS